MNAQSEQPDSSESALMLLEFTHRTNNELASAIGLVSVAFARTTSEDARRVLQRVQLMLQNYAQLQRALEFPRYSGSMDAAAHLQQICCATSCSKLVGSQTELVCAAQPVELAAARCWRLGLIVSELVANGSRHAFEAGPGLIHVGLINHGTFAECSVADNGRGSAALVPGRGLTIVDALVKGLGGFLQHYSSDRGTAWILSFPIAAQPDEHRFANLLPSVQVEPTYISDSHIFATMRTDSLE